VKWQIASRVPFAVMAEPATIEGVPLPAGGYFDGAYIRNLNANFITAGTINGDFVNVTKALKAADVTAGAIWTGDVTSTSNTVVNGVSNPSFSINASTGLATFNNAVVRGRIEANQGYLRGLDIEDSAGNVILSAGNTLASQMDAAASSLLLNSAIVVGGRNFLRNSGDFTSTTYWISSGSVITVDSAVLYGAKSTLKFVGGYAYNNQLMRLKPNTQYTISAMVKGSAALAGWYDKTLHIQNWSDENTANVHQESQVAFDTAVTTSWKRIYTTFTTCNSANLTYCRFYFYPLSDGYVLNVGYIKAEEGNKATDWSPAPEDVDAGIALASTTANWTDVASRPTSLATLNSTDGSKLAGIAAGATANQADSVVNAALGDRLKKSGTDIMSGQVQLTSSYAMWFGTSGYANGPTGVYIGSSGIVGKKGGAVTFSLDNAGNATFGGNVVGAQFTTGAYTGYAWPAVNNYGTYLGPSGLLIGNANNNKYLQVTQDGNIYAPGLTIVNGAATFSGALSAARGTFSGTLTASAVNAVNTINLAGQAVTIPVSAFTAAAISYTYSTQVQTATITSTGAPIIVLVSVALDINAGVATMVIKRNGTDIYVTRSLGNLSVCLQDTPGAGPKTYTAFVGWSNYSTDATYLARYRTIVLLETKR